MMDALDNLGHTSILCLASATHLVMMLGRIMGDVSSNRPLQLLLVEPRPEHHVLLEMHFEHTQI
jgi:hypothetical protein